MSQNDCDRTTKRLVSDAVVYYPENVTPYNLIAATVFYEYNHG